MEIIKNENIYKSLEVNNNFTNQEIMDRDIGKEETYYIRVNLENRHIAWTSPIWFTRK